MFTVVEGECSTGKSRYLAYLRKTNKDAYFIGVDNILNYPIDKELLAAVFGDDYPLDCMKYKDIARTYMTNMCRRCSLLLLDEIGYFIPDYDDGRILTTYLIDVGEYKDVVAVSYDMNKLYLADRIVTVTWEDGVPNPKEIDLDEAIKIVWG